MCDSQAIDLQAKLKAHWHGAGYYDLFCNGLNDYKPGSYVMLFTNDSDGGYCYVRMSLVFNSAHDILAYFRFALIPHLLSDYVGNGDEILFPDAESYFGEIEPETVDKVKLSLSMIDVSFSKKSITKQDLEKIRQNYNVTFKDGYFDEIEIHAWGTLEDVIESKYVSDAFSDGAEEFDFEDEEYSERQKAYKNLNALIRKKELDDTNPEHLKNAIKVLEMFETYP